MTTAAKLLPELRPEPSSADGGPSQRPPIPYLRVVADRSAPDVVDGGGTREAAILNEKLPSVRQIIAHHWECVVTDVGTDHFTAILRSLRGTEDGEKEADIPIDEVSEDDLELLKRGAIFYWTIGYATSRAGTRTRFSALKFRRLPIWTPKEIARLKKDTAKLVEAFGRQP